MAKRACRDCGEDFLPRPGQRRCSDCIRGGPLDTVSEMGRSYNYRLTEGFKQMGGDSDE